MSNNVEHRPTLDHKQEGSFCKMVKNAFALFMVFAVLFFLALAVLGPAMAALTVLGFLFLISFARFELKG